MAGAQSPQQPGGTGPAEAGPPGRAPAHRLSRAWVALTAGLIFLVVVLVFIVQNLHSVKVHFFWGTWTAPLALDLLFAAVLGGLTVAAVGWWRIVHIRRTERSVGRRGKVQPADRPTRGPAG